MSYIFYAPEVKVDVTVTAAALEHQTKQQRTRQTWYMTAEVTAAEVDGRCGECRGSRRENSKPL